MKRTAKELIRVLVADQEDDGSFSSLSVPKGDSFGVAAKRYRTTFVGSLIAAALANVPGEEAAQVRNKVADFLLAQPKEQWSFNYWARLSPEAKTKPYPDDWDDTSCAIIALTLTRPKLVTGEVLGHIVTLLTNTETVEGGPYRTWIVSDTAPQHWQDIDIAVNSNIAYMLALHGVELPNLSALADARIETNQLRSPYYPSEYPILYFLSRWYKGKHREELIENILGLRRDGKWGTPLDTALAVSTALNFGADRQELKAAVDWLQELGEVTPQAFCIDPAIDGQQYVAGARALTAAFCLEAICKYEEKEKNYASESASVPATQNKEADKIHHSVVEQVMGRLSQPGSEIQAAAQQMHDRLLNGSATGQITMLAYRFREALGDEGKRINDARILELGRISFFGWIAYTVYDDFLDDEGRPPLLPLANLALRELVLELQQEGIRTHGFGELAWRILDQQEAANAWEVSHCRVPRQSDLLQVQVPQFGDLHALADRSMGHSLGCLAITMELGFGPDSPQVQAVLDFFRHYLIARQLGDDVHDWQADLHNGQINAVGAHILSGVSRRKTSVHALYTQLEEQFWSHSLGEVNEWIRRELALARKALADATFIRHPEALEILMIPIEEGVHHAEITQSQASEFLRAYQAPGAAGTSSRV